MTFDFWNEGPYQVVTVIKLYSLLNVGSNTSLTFVKVLTVAMVTYCILTGIEFQNNMNEDKTELYFSTDQLKGCSEDFIKGTCYKLYYIA